MINRKIETPIVSQNLRQFEERNERSRPDMNQHQVTPQNHFHPSPKTKDFRNSNQTSQARIKTFEKQARNMDSLDTYGKNSRQNYPNKSVNSGSVLRSPVKEGLLEYANPAKLGLGYEVQEGSRSVQGQMYDGGRDRSHQLDSRSHKNSFKASFTDRFESGPSSRYKYPQNEIPIVPTENKIENAMGHFSEPANVNSQLGLNPENTFLDSNRETRNRTDLRKFKTGPSENYFKPRPNNWESEAKVNIYSHEIKQNEHLKKPNSVTQSLSYIKSLENLKQGGSQNIYYKQEGVDSLYGPQKKFKANFTIHRGANIVEAYSAAERLSRRASRANTLKNSRSNLSKPQHDQQPQIRHMDSEDFKIEAVSNTNSRRSSKAHLMPGKSHLEKSQNKPSQKSLIELNTDYIERSMAKKPEESRQALIRKNSEIIKNKMRKYNSKYMPSQVMSDDSQNETEGREMRLTEKETESEQVTDSENYYTNSTLQSEVGGGPMMFESQSLDDRGRHAVHGFNAMRTEQPNQHEMSQKNLGVNFEQSLNPRGNYDFNKSKKLNTIQFESQQDQRPSNLEMINQQRPGSSLQIASGGIHSALSPRMIQSNIQRYNTTGQPVGGNSEGQQNFFPTSQMGMNRPVSSPVVMVPYDRQTNSSHQMETRHIQGSQPHIHPTSNTHLQPQNIPNHLVYPTNGNSNNMIHPQTNSYENLPAMGGHYQLYPPQNTPRQQQQQQQQQHVPRYGSFYPGNNLYQKHGSHVTGQMDPHYQSEFQGGHRQNYNLVGANPSLPQGGYNVNSARGGKPKKRKRARRAKNRKKTISMGGESSDLDLNKLNQKILRKREKKKYERMNTTTDRGYHQTEDFHASPRFQRKRTQGSGYY